MNYCVDVKDQLHYFDQRQKRRAIVLKKSYPDIRTFLSTTADLTFSLYPILFPPIEDDSIEEEVLWFISFTSLSSESAVGAYNL